MTAQGIAISANFVSAETILDALTGATGDLQRDYIDAVRERAESGCKTDPRIVSLIAEYAFAEHEQADPAIYALTEIMLRNESNYISYLPKIRALLYQNNEYRIKHALGGCPKMV